MPAPAPTPLSKVSVESNPKPCSPTQYSGTCAPGLEHAWGVRGNRHWRAYYCALCGLNVHEKKANRYWRIGMVIVDTRLPTNARPSLPDPGNSNISASQDTTAMLPTVYGDLVSDLDGDKMAVNCIELDCNGSQRIALDCSELHQIALQCTRLDEIG